MKPYERFEAWQLCHQLTLAIYTVTKTFPNDERYGLVAQARRAAFSSAANIAEGSAKRGVAEFRRYLDIALGSLSEMSYTLRLSSDLGYLSSEDAVHLFTLLERASKVTWGLYQSMTSHGIRRAATAARQPASPPARRHS
jgi:four helix bundle protein